MIENLFSKLSGRQMGSRPVHIRQTDNAEYSSLLVSGGSVSVAARADVIGAWDNNCGDAAGSQDQGGDRHRARYVMDTRYLCILRDAVAQDQSFMPLHGHVLLTQTLSTSGGGELPSNFPSDATVRRLVTKLRSLHGGSRRHKTSH